MPALHRQWSAVLLAVLTGCVSQPRYEELPPAQLEPAPPRPITAVAPPLAAGPRSPPSPLANLMMGRLPLPAPVLPPAVPPTKVPSLGKTNVPPFQPSLARQATLGCQSLEKPQSILPRSLSKPIPVAAPVSTNLNFRQIIALQTLLDRQNFSCNCADGKIGSRTRAALHAFQAASGLPMTGSPSGATIAALGDLGAAFTTYTVTEDDHAQLTQNPTTWLGRSQAARLGYPTILEAVAERGHATQQAIRDLNPQVTVWPDPPAGTMLTVPDVGSSEKLPHAARIRISIGNKLVRVFDDAGKQAAQFPCSIARDPAKREPCEISVAVVAPNPNYTFDPALFSEEPESKTIKTKLIIPAGPRNPVGVAWIGLSKTGYGMHGTPKPEDIGKTESHGCFRLANWNAQKLLRMVDIGTPVTVEE